MRNRTVEKYSLAMLFLFFFSCSAFVLKAQSMADAPSAEEEFPLPGYFANVAYYPEDGCYYAVKGEVETIDKINYFLCEKVAVVGKTMVIDRPEPGLSWTIIDNHLKNGNGKWLGAGHTLVNKVSDKNILNTFKEKDATDPTIQWIRTPNGTYEMFVYDCELGKICFRRYDSLSELEKKRYFPAYIYDIAAGYLRVNLDKGSYGTICLPQNVTTENWTGATFYEIIGKKMNGDEVASVRVKEVTELKAGHPYIFQAQADIMATLPGTDVVETPVEQNGLIGSFEVTDVAEGMYIIYDNTLKRCGNGCKIDKNRAYIDMKKVPELSKAQENEGVAMMMYDQPTGTASVNTDASLQNTTQTHDVWGRTVQPFKGQIVITRQNKRSSKVLVK